ncbi:MAG: hypothetical protein LH679_24195 [Cyanobacteria bacterium CAN_BIN43]|nr:hypothetical protein [Cyanobacteria bacterium CAN_BIN43]
MPKKQQGNGKPSGKSAQIIDALTEQELTQLIEVLFGVLSSQQTEQAIAQLSPDTQQTLQQILKPSPTSKKTQAAATQTASLAKQQQTWSKLWKDWNAILNEAEKERSKYIIQEAHWEQPYFDTTTFVEDLEEVADKMRPLVPIAFEQNFTPDDGFIPALQAAASMSIGGEDWMEITEGLALEPQITYCLLEWEWLELQSQGQDAFKFVQHIRQKEIEFQNVSFEYEAILDFLTQLTEPDQRRILAGLTEDQESPSWVRVLTDTSSHWHQLYLELIEQHAPERYLDHLRGTIPQQWKNGLPIIETLLSEQNYAASLVAIEETLQSLLKQKVDEWTPETLLLNVAYSGFYDEATKASILLLLNYYQQTAQGLNQIERANALEIQQMAIAQGLDWSVMFKAFANSPVSKPTHQALFTSWQNYIERLSKPYTWAGYRRSPVDSWWLLWLIDSIADPQKGKAWFQKKITQWITNLSGDRDQLGENYDLLRLLTKDLTDIQGKAKTSFPLFYGTVIAPQELDNRNSPARQSYLKLYAPTDLLAQVMTYWQTNLHNLAPKPAAVSKSDYTAIVRWMAALKELSPSDYQSLRNQWRVTHQRRSNLWKAMEQAGLC